MKIQELTVENFGIFRRKQFEFSAAPLVLIYGNNEAGKTTALNAIRQALFGFKPRSSYLTGNTMQAEAKLSLRDGRTLQFTRTKGRRDQVLSTLDGLQLAEGEFEKFFGSLDLTSYENLFGFSQEELRLGQGALKDAGLSEALAGGSFGGINLLENLRQELAQSLAELYKARGSTSKINLKLSDIQQCHQELQKTQVAPTTIQEIRRELRETQEEYDRLRQETSLLTKQRTEAERKLEALPAFKRRLSALAELESIEIPAGVDSTFLAQWGDQTQGRKDLQARLQVTQQSRQKLNAELETLGGDNSLLEAEDLIESLGHQASAIAAQRQEKGDLELRVAESKAKLRDLLSLVGLEKASQELLEFSISLPQKRKIEALEARFCTCKEKLIAARAQLKLAQQDNEAKSSQPSSDAIPNNLEELHSKVLDLRDMELETQHRLEILENQLSAQDFAKLSQQLQTALLPGYQLHPGWNLPPRKEVEQFVDSTSQLQIKLGQLQAEETAIRAQQEQVNSGTEDKNNAKQRQSQKVLENLATFDSQRDAILQQWLDELSQPLIAASISIDEQHERLLELQRIAACSDEAKSQLLDIADAIAQQRQSLLAAEKHREQLADLQAKKAELQKEIRAQEDSWRSALSALPLEPLTPAAFQAWAEQFSAWLAQTQKNQQSRKELHLLRGRMRAIRESLLDDWPEPIRGDESAQTLLDMIQKWQEAHKAAQQAHGRIEQSRRTIRDLKQQISELQQASQDCGDEFAQWLAQAPIDLDWPTDEALHLVETLESIRSEARHHQDLSRRLTSHADNLKQFESRVADLQDQLGISPAREANRNSTAEEWALNHFRKLREIRKQKSRRIELLAELKQTTQLESEFSQQLQELDAKLVSLCALVGSESPTEARSVLQRVQRAEDLRKTIQHEGATLLAFCQRQTLEELCAELTDIDQAELELQIQEARLLLSRLEEQRDQQQKTIGQFEERLEALAKSTQSQRLQQTLSHHRGELAELSEQWIVTKLAQEMLSKSIELFARENEPQVLKRAHSFLAALTHGRYTMVEHDSGSKEPFFVRNANGESFTPDRLSTGTREQLYLAIRMAYIAQHCEDHEPLPVIMDDCFVNFDDTRTEQCVRAIADWSPDIQTIILSCHSRLPQIVSKVAPSASIVELDAQQSLTTA